MKKFLVLVAFIVVAVAAFYAGDQHGMKENGAMMDHDADPRLSAASTMLIGTWSSEDDRNFQREYKADGTLVDDYASASGSTLTDAKWALFTADMPDVGATFQLNNKDVYITQTENDGSKTYFRISSVTPEQLELVNMTKGGGLRFGKMTTGHEMQDGLED